MSKKITKKQTEQHEKAAQLLWGMDRRLKRGEVAFCLANWDPRADHKVVHNDAYFTPMPLALELARGVGGNGRHVVDICAGIGHLAHAVLCANDWQVKITAVEFNPEYVRVGQRLLPERGRL